MQLEVKKYLSDIRTACQRLTAFTAGKSFRDNESDELLQAAVDRSADLIDRRRPAEQAAADHDEDLIDVPDIADSTLLASDPPGIDGTQFAAPASDRPRREDPSVREQIPDVSEAQRESAAEPSHMADGLRRRVMTAVGGLHRAIVAVQCLR